MAEIRGVFKNQGGLRENAGKSPAPITSDHYVKLSPLNLPCQVPIVGSNTRHQLDVADIKLVTDSTQRFGQVSV